MQVGLGIPMPFYRERRCVSDPPHGWISDRKKPHAREPRGYPSDMLSPVSRTDDLIWHRVEILYRAVSGFRWRLQRRDYLDNGNSGKAGTNKESLREPWLAWKPREPKEGPWSARRRLLNRERLVRLRNEGWSLGRLSTEFRISRTHVARIVQGSKHSHSR